ncbi:hypothetical protein L596_023034 [Steinernema carpocapsae]|uniref:ShKT domain-containing protein n=1 Tax=Steinernema carpocapsae TaxID=34508 RepID=A0A4U5MCE3_STECR|nr:hypothetical protein L596_023034 [Steinernema carpocapsae]
MLRFFVLVCLVGCIASAAIPAISDKTWEYKNQDYDNWNWQTTCRDDPSFNCQQQIANNDFCNSYYLTFAHKRIKCGQSCGFC